LALTKKVTGRRIAVVFYNMQWKRPKGTKGTKGIERRTPKKWKRLTKDFTHGDTVSVGDYTCEVSSDSLVVWSKADQALKSASQDVTLSDDALQLLYALGCGCTCRGMTPEYHCGCGCSHCLVLK
jgi:hypothetical protein